MQNTLAIIATHDLELAERLNGQCDFYHFTGNVDKNGLKFDYLLKPGIATTRKRDRLTEVSWISQRNNGKSPAGRVRDNWTILADTCGLSTLRTKCTGIHKAARYHFALLSVKEFVFAGNNQRSGFECPNCRVGFPKAAAEGTQFVTDVRTRLPEFVISSHCISLCSFHSGGWLGTKL